MTPIQRGVEVYVFLAALKMLIKLGMSCGLQMPI